jgi:uncharacterized membrane protein
VFEATEHHVTAAVSWLRLGVEAVGAAVICFGILAVITDWVRGLTMRKPPGFHQIRLILARYLALALEFQLAADILSTAVAPTWDQIGKLGAIAVIRTALNFFLMKELETEQARAADAAA